MSHQLVEAIKRFEQTWALRDATRKGVIGTASHSAKNEADSAHAEHMVSDAGLAAMLRDMGLSAASRGDVWYVALENPARGNPGIQRIAPLQRIEML